MENRDQQKNIVAKYFDQHFFFLPKHKSTKINKNQQKSTFWLISVCLLAQNNINQQKSTNPTKTTHRRIFVRSPPKKPTTFMFEINKI